MAGLFELFVDAQLHVRFRLTAPDGTVLAVSKSLDDKPAAVAGIAAFVSTPAWDTSPTFARPAGRTLRRRVQFPGSLPKPTGQCRQLNPAHGRGHSTGPQPKPVGPAPPDREDRHHRLPAGAMGFLRPEAPPVLKSSGPPRGARATEVFRRNRDPGMTGIGRPGHEDPLNGER
jgi:hypothetical protein